MRKLILLAVAISSCFVFANQSLAQTQQQSGSPRQASNNRQASTASSTAAQMVAAIQLASAGVSSGMSPIMALALPGVNTPERTEARKSLTQAAREVTGESFSGKEALTLELGLIQWMTGRTNLNIYSLRARRLSKALLQDWQSVQATLDARQSELTLVLLGIIFHDQLWEGADWKAGHPQLALTRLKGLPATAVTKWAAASKVELRFAVANSLISIDSLFSGNSFDMQRFEEALPLAQKTLDKTSTNK